MRRAQRFLQRSFVGVILALTPALHAAVPVLEHFYPAGAQRGQTITVTAAGKFDTWPAQAWSDCPALSFTPGKEPGHFSVKVSGDAPTGPHLVRLHTADGASALRVFLVGTHAESNEAEPNDEFIKAQKLGTLPLTVNGQLEKPGDSDCYALELEAGQCLVASVHGRRLGAPMDPLLQLLDSSGHTMSFTHDGLGLDPVLVYRAQRRGTVIVRILAFAHPPAADVKLAGGKANIYRLSLTTGPFVRYVSPSGIGRNTTRVRLLGWNLPPSGQPFELSAAALRGAWRTGTCDLPTLDGEGRIRLDAEQTLDEQVEDHAASRPATPSSLPIAITGTLALPGEQDRVSFTARKGEKLTLILRSIAVASAMDAVLQVEDSTGKLLARDDDNDGAGNARMEWTAPEDGTYRAVVSDLNGHGGEDFVYRLSIQAPAPEVQAAVDTHEYRLEPGKTVVIKLAVARTHGHTAPLLAVAAPLPAGVTTTRTPVPPAGGEMTLTLTASADAPPATVPFRVTLLDADEMPLARQAFYDLRREANQEVVQKATSFWLTVLPRPQATQPAAPKK